MDDPTQQEVTSLFSTLQKRILIVVVAGLFIIFSIVLLLFSLTQQGKQSSQQAFVTPTSVPVRSLNQKAKPAPVVSFAQYTNQATVPTIPSSLKTYTLKTNFSLEEVKEFAKQFGLTAYKPTVQKEIVFYSEEKDTRGYMVFNKETGIFSFQSWGILTPTTRGTTPQTTALSFLKQVGIADNTLSCSITYKRKILSNDLTFVECHRMPEKLGTILVNPAGILNLSENISLSTLKVGYAGNNSPVDKDIYSSNIGEDGKARPNDFNTITIGVFQDGRIFSVDSTIRWIKEPTSIITILSPQEALDNFRQQKANFSLTIPAGQGVVSWDTVYPKNKAEADTAAITDYKLVYLEKPPTATQVSYEPYYLIRGTARLKTGYMVRFVQTVPATVPNSVLGTSTTKQLAQLQLKPYYPPTNTPVPTRTPTPTTITNPAIPTNTPPYSGTPTAIPTRFQTIPTPDPEQTVACVDYDGDYPDVVKTTLTIEGYGTIVVRRAGNASAGYPRTFYLVSASESVKDFNTVREIFFKALEEDFVKTTASLILQATIGLENNDIKRNQLRQLVQSVRSVDDVYNIFDHITSSLDLPCESQHIVPVPISVACAKKQNELYGIPYNTERIEKIRTAVAQRIYTAIVEDKVNYLLLSGDYMFPVATRSMFNALFIESLGEFPNPEEAFQKTCYISGDSPAIFLYAKNSLASIVEPVSSVAYTHPVLTTNRWETITKKNTVVVNGMPYDYLYYEYDGTKVQFREPKEGYVVKKTEWKKVAETIASQIGLNDKEKQALFTDIQNALPKVQTPYMKISIVNEQEVAEKLPLNISPTPDTIRRIHLLLSPQRATPKPAVPVFSPIVRNDFTIVEVGVAVGK